MKRRVWIVGAIVASMLAVIAVIVVARGHGSPAPSSAPAGSAGQPSAATDPVGRTSTVAVGGTEVVSVAPAELSDTQLSGLMEGWPKLPLAVGVPVEISAARVPAGGITITRRYAVPLPAEASATMVYFDPDLSGWRAVPSKVAKDRLSVSATVHHLSLWTDVVGIMGSAGQAVQNALVGATTWLYNQVGSIFSTRADRPMCPGGKPAWVDDVVTIDDDAANPIRFCYGNRDGRLVVKATINRGFGFVAHPGAPVTSIQNSTYEPKDFADAVRTAVHIDDQLRQSAADMFGGGNIVGAGETLTLTFDESDGRAAGQDALKLDAPNTEEFLVSILAGLVGLDLENKVDGWVGAGLAIAQCATDLQNATSGSKAAKAIITCASGLDEDVARQIVNFEFARHGKADGAKIGGLVGRVSIYLALIGPVFDTFDYAAARATSESARNVSLFVKPENVTKTTLLTAEVPAACHMPRQRLKDNQTTKTEKDYPGAAGGFSMTAPPQLADITGRGYKQAVSYYACSAGGVSWPPVVVLTGQAGALLGYVNLDELTNQAHGDRGTIESLQVDNQKRVVVKWTSTTGCCAALAKHRTVLSWGDSHLFVESDRITQWSADGVAWEIAVAAVGGDRGKLLDPAAVPDDLWRQLVVAAKGANEGFSSLPLDDGGPDEIVFEFGGTQFVSWNARMARASNRYGWRLVSATPE